MPIMAIAAISVVAHGLIVKDAHEDSTREPPVRDMPAKEFYRCARLKTL